VLESEPRVDRKPKISQLNTSLQSSAIELLHSIFSVLVLDGGEGARVEAVVIRKLFVAVHTGRHELHGPLLHLLHTLVYATVSRVQLVGDEASLHHDADRNRVQTLIVSQLLLQTLGDGLRLSFMGRTYRHWLDFLLHTIPLFRPPQQDHILSLIEFLSTQIRSAASELDKCWPIGGNSGSGSFFVNELDFLALLAALEKLTLLMPSLSNAQTSPLTTLNPERGMGNAESGGLLGIVSSVFSTETPHKGIGTEDVSLI
jgi:hypothetical protein